MKRALQVVLLAVVVLSILWLIVPRQSTTRRTSQFGSAPAEYVAYYFHRTARCVTCLKIENAAHDVILRDFVDALRDGKLLFIPTDVEASGNEHFVKDYELVSQALVLVRYADGKPVQAHNLDRIWDLIGERAQFDQYVHDEVSTFLGTTL